MQRLTEILSRNVDNSPLILFRIFFGLLMFFEGIGAILTGWLKETFVDPQFTFNFIGLDFLQVLVGPQMYGIYVILSLLGLAIMFGWYYRIASGLFILLWGSAYLLQKSHYNNHYYLVWLISMMLLIVPANNFRSLDVGQQRTVQCNTCPLWCIFIFQFQIAIVYFYAAIAKIYPDWLEARPMGLWFSHRSYESIIWGDGMASALKDFFSRRTFHYFISYAGIFFDLLIIPAFLWKRTRTLALVASLVFHMMNSLLFQIGVFPYFSLSFIIFFYPRETIRRIFFPRKKNLAVSSTASSRMPRWSVLIAVYFIIQLLLPLRHWRIQGDVLWTEEGHRLSWRMMLRAKSSHVKVTVRNAETGIYERVELSQYLTPHQIADLGSKPDMIWQFAQILQKDYLEHSNTAVEIYVDSKVSVNGRSYEQFTDQSVDLSGVKWKRYGHQDWIMDRSF